MKICLMPGHAPGKPGAELATGGMSEYEFARSYIAEVAEELKAMGYEVCRTERTVAGGVTPSYSARAANSTGAELTVELHFNSATPAAEGAECLYYAPSATSAAVAKAWLDRWCELSGYRNRGVLPCCADDTWAALHRLPRHTTNGWGAFKNSKSVFLMAEPFFGSNDHESMKAVSLQRRGYFALWMAKAIAAAAEQVRRGRCSRI